MPPQNPWWVLPGLAGMILFIFGGALVASCFLGNDTLRTTMFTAAITITTAAVSYYFGSSAGSQKKDDTLAQVATNTPPPPPP